MLYRGATGDPCNAFVLSLIQTAKSSYFEHAANVGPTSRLFQATCRHAHFCLLILWHLIPQFLINSQEHSVRRPNALTISLSQAFVGDECPRSVMKFHEVRTCDSERKIQKWGA